jgi:hypothetical protein
VVFGRVVLVSEEGTGFGEASLVANLYSRRIRLLMPVPAKIFTTGDTEEHRVNSDLRNVQEITRWI